MVRAVPRLSSRLPHRPLHRPLHRAARLGLLAALAVLSAFPLPSQERPAASAAVVPGTLPWQPVGTFSILGYDPATGEVGGAVQSRVFSVGNGVLWAEAGVGVVATQAIVDVSYGPQALALLREGKPPAEVVKTVWERDPDPRPQDWTKFGRQFAVIDAQGRVAAYTGPKASAYAGDRQGAYCTAQGNILAGEAVVAGMVRAFEQTEGHLSLRLLAALEAGQAAGGDTRGMQSAAMVVVKKGGGVWLNNDAVLRLQVDDHPEPIAELRRLVEKAAQQRRPRAATAPAASAAALRTTHVVLIMTDGLRWQELFDGAQRPLMGKAGKVADTAALRRDFWRDTAVERRAALFPFLWGTVAAQGQLFGDTASRSPATLLNPLQFSYPGYHEAFAGWYDPRIDSNDHPANPNVTVFEWLHQDPALRGQVAAWGTWHAFRRILNAERSGIPVHDGWDRGVPAAVAATHPMLARLYGTTARLWPEVAFDALMQQSLLAGLARQVPRLLFAGYGETDEWAHAGRYDLYLRSARQWDAYVAELWARYQADPRTRGRTTFILTTDHGRGDGAEWTDHGQDVRGAGGAWIAVLGPDTPAGGVRVDAPVRQGQVAATIAALLGKDWVRAEPRAAAPLPVFR